MAGVDTVAALLYKLNDMETVLRFNYLGNLLGVVEVKCHRGKLRHELSAAEKTCFATANSLGRLRVKNGECGELAFATVNAVGIVAKSRFHVVDLLPGYHRVESDYLHFYLQWHERHAVGGQLVEITAHIARSNL